MYLWGPTWEHQGGVIFPTLGLGLGFEETPAARRGGRRAAPRDPMRDMIWASKIGIC